MTPSSDDRVRAIRDALEKMTPGPWGYCRAQDKRGGCPCGLIWSKPVDNVVASTDTDSKEEGISSTQKRKVDDGRGIALLRNEAPWLLSRLAKAEAVVEAVRTAWAKCQASEEPWRMDYSALQRTIYDALAAYDRDTEGGP